MNTLILCSPDIYDRNFADVFDRVPEKLVLPLTGLRPETTPGSPQQRIFALHQSVLADQQKYWFQRFSSNGQTPDFANYEVELDSILDSMGSDWLLQDPLLVHLLPLWLSRVNNPVLFLYYTEPLECALALQQKWRFPIAFGLALWESYMLTAANNLGDHPCIPVSCTKLRQSPQAAMDFIHKQIRGIYPKDSSLDTEKCISWPPLASSLKTDLPAYSDFLQDSQKGIFKLLENGEIKQLEDKNLAPQSADILDYYGQLRAGFEMLKQKHDDLVERPNLDLCDDTAENTSASRHPKPGPKAETASTLRSVTVHIEGMEAIEFVVESNSSILKMLEHSLQTTGQTPDELVYLDYENEGTSALYFMKSRLLGIETTPLSN
jgi:hypothetical protein